MKTAEHIELVFDTEAYLDLSYTMLEGSSGISKNKGTYLCNFFPNSALRKFSNCTLIITGAVNLGGRSV